MIRLSAFADEISSNLHEQIAVLKREDIYHLTCGQLAAQLCLT